MGLKADAGVRVYPTALAVAALTYTPFFDRAAKIRRISLGNLSADDNWTVAVAGREIMRFRMLTAGNQRLLLIPTAGSAWQPNFFDWVRYALGLDPSIPVPQGLSVTVASVGGATADIVLEAEEHDPHDFDAPGLNHYRGTQFLMPITMRLAAGQALPAAVTLDTQDAPAYLPSLVNGVPLPPGWEIDVLAIFTEGMGVNTFSGAANHASISQDLDWIRNGERLFTRQGQPGASWLPGIPDVGSAAAAGSANTVFGQRTGVYPPFQLSADPNFSALDYPIPFRSGDASQVQVNLTGDLTGTASYARDLFVAICKVMTPAALGG